MEIKIIDYVPSWEELMNYKVGTILDYKNTKLIRKINFVIEIDYNKPNYKTKVICLCKEHYEKELNILNKI